MMVQLVIDAFFKWRAGTRYSNAGRLFIPNRGSQYVAVEFRRLLYIYDFRQSMLAKGNCYDNAQAESFFSRFKAELIEDAIFESNE
jgi:transposase InsO family protein